MNNLAGTRLKLYIISFGLIISACIGGGLYYMQIPFDWNWFVGIVIFFLCLEPLIVSLVVSGSRKKDKKQMVNMYMLTKVIKVLASLVFIAIYVLAVKENIKIFVTVFIMFYLLYLIVETLLFLNLEKQLKEKKNSSDE